MEIVAVAAAVAAAAATAVTRERWEKQKEAWNSLHNGKKKDWVRETKEVDDYNKSTNGTACVCVFTLN
ncbi:MAG: hypothetical protein QXI19_09920 [Candidatus Caldarchaeum sp.]